MKAVEKDRQRRYATAAEFAADIDCYLENEPVLASPPGAAYRTRKFVRRKLPVLAAAACALPCLPASSLRRGKRAWRGKRGPRPSSKRPMRKGSVFVRSNRQRRLASSATVPKKKRARLTSNAARRKGCSAVCPARSGQLHAIRCGRADFRTARRHVRA